MNPDSAQFIAAMIGALIGWGGAHFEGRWQHRRALKSLRASLAVEILSLVELARRNNYVEELRSIAEELHSKREEARFNKLAIHAGHSYFSIFEGNTDKIGAIEQELAVDVVAFYQQARSWLDSLSPEIAPDVVVLTIDEIAEHYSFLADTLMKLSKFGEDLAQRLAPGEIQRHIAETAAALDAS